MKRFTPLIPVLLIFGVIPLVQAQGSFDYEANKQALVQRAINNYISFFTQATPTADGLAQFTDPEARAHIDLEDIQGGIQYLDPSYEWLNPEDVANIPFEPGAVYTVWLRTKTNSKVGIIEFVVRQEGDLRNLLVKRQLRIVSV